MYFNINGIVSHIDINYIVIDNNGIGYLIYVSDPYKYKINNTYNVYLYQQIREEENNLFGFLSLDEKKLFIKLIGVKGLGCKMAINLLRDNISYLCDAIEKGDISYLKKFPKIGDKLARQIVLDLKGKLTLSDDSKKDYNNELEDALKSLGYKQNDVKNVVKEVDKSLALEKQIKEALKLLLK